MYINCMLLCIVLINKDEWMILLLLRFLGVEDCDTAPLSRTVWNVSRIQSAAAVSEGQSLLEDLVLCVLGVRVVSRCRV